MTLPLNRRQFLGAAAAAGVGGAALRAAPTASPAKFQLGLVTYNVAKDWDLPTLLKNCRAAGIAAVEARTTHKHGIEPTLSAEERAAVRKQFADSGVQFWGSGSTCEFHSPDPAVVAKSIEECKRFLSLVKDLGGKGVKVRPNGVGKGMTVPQACEQIGTALKACGEAAGDLGLEVWIEVHGNPTQQPKTMRAIMDACGHPAVGVTWNSNATDVVNGSIAESFELLKPFIKSCHITDLKQDAAGKYPYRDLFARLTAMGYDRYTLCEVGTVVDAAEGTEYLREYKKLWDSLLPS